MKIKYLLTASASVAVLSLASNTVLAQKSTGTIRTAFTAPVKTVDLYIDPKPENGFLTRTVYDGMVYYEEATGKFRPLLAKSWKQLSGPFGLEFELRDDVKWTDGEKFNADDVVYMVNWLINPKTKLRFKKDYAWIDRVEKLGPHKVRIVGKRPFTPALMRSAYSMLMYPEHVHSKLKNKRLFGQKPVSTGPFKITTVDRNKGVVAERNENYKHGGTWKPQTNVKKWVAMPMPEAGTQTAQMLAGNLDVIRAHTDDQAKSLAAQPNLSMSFTQGLGFTYILFDAKGRSGNSALKDVRVRRAVLMGINRKEIQDLGAGTAVRQPQALCYDQQRGCGYSTKPPAFDPAGAKKLLAEAGHPNGFDVEITTFTGRTGTVAEVVAGQLRKIGLKTKLQRRTIGAYRKKQRQGKLQILVGGWSAGGLPDVQGTVRIFANPPKSSRDYFGDPQLFKMSRRVNSITDDAKRRAHVAKIFDRMTEQAYIVPLVASSIPFVYTNEVKVNTGAFNPFGANMTDISFK